MERLRPAGAHDATGSRQVHLHYPQPTGTRPEILGTPSESEAIREALRLVAWRYEVMQGFDKVAGKAPDFRDMWEQTPQFRPLSETMHDQGWVIWPPVAHLSCQ